MMWERNYLVFGVNATRNFSYTALDTVENAPSIIFFVVLMVFVASALARGFGSVR